MSARTLAADAVSELAIEVFRLNGLLLDAGDRLARPAGQTSARWQVLGVVEHGPASVAQVARAMGLTRQSVQRTADLLAADGLVAYAENPHHRRAKLVTLTSVGDAALGAIRGRHAQWANRIGAGQSPEGLRAAVATLRRVRESLERDAQRTPDGNVEEEGSDEPGEVPARAAVGR